MRCRWRRRSFGLGIGRGSRTDGSAAKEARRLFHIRCSDGSRTFCLLWSYTVLGNFRKFTVLRAVVRPYQTACP